MCASSATPVAFLLPALLIMAPGSPRLRVWLARFPNLAFRPPRPSLLPETWAKKAKETFAEFEPWSKNTARACPPLSQWMAPRPSTSPRRESLRTDSISPQLARFWRAQSHHRSFARDREIFGAAAARRASQFLQFRDHRRRYFGEFDPG